MKPSEFRFENFVLRLVKAGFVFALAVSPLFPINLQADGVFVFKWNKQKDINEPTQKAIIVHDAGREDLLLQVKYEGPPEEFGWLIPVPSLPKVEKGSMKCFYELSRFTQKQLGSTVATLSAGRSKGEDENVKVIETKTVGAYEIAVLSAKNAGSLEQWLKTHGFSLPEDKSGIIESYLKKQWYFIAVRVGAMELSVPEKQNLQRKLATGELHPLQISFPSEKCIFPLKISALNGKPSEVSLYIIARELLVEKAIFDKNLAQLHRQREERKKAEPAQQRAREQTMRNLQVMSMASALYQQGVKPDFGERSVEGLHALAERLEGPRKPKKEKPRDRDNESFYPFLPSWLVTTKDFPECAKSISRLNDGSWYLSKQMRTFSPVEMNDLEFESAVPILTALLPSEDGFASAQLLSQLGTNGATALLPALQTTNALLRIHASSALPNLRGLRADKLLLNLIQDPEPEVRMNAVWAAHQNWDSRFVDPLINLFNDEDEDVRRAATQVLILHNKDFAEKTSIFLKLLKDPNPDVQACALRLLTGIPNTKIPREDLLRLLAIPQKDVVGSAFGLLRNEKPLSSDEAVPLLQNSMGFAKLLGLKVLQQNGDNRAVDLAIPLLKDADDFLKKRAGTVLEKIAGQNIPYDQPQKWEEWWAANKTGFARAPEAISPKSN